MIYLALPIGLYHGWGIVGRMLARELSRLTPVELYTNELTMQQAADESEYKLLRGLLPADADPLHPPPGRKVDGPVLGLIVTLNQVYLPELRGTFNAGYIVFEEDLLPRTERRILESFDHVAVASTWCADALKSAGFPRVSVVLQGIDPELFNSRYSTKNSLKEYFVIFSGGKLEYRKAQDVVIRATAIFQQRHADVVLINAWHNVWPVTAQNMAASRLVHFPPFQGDQVQYINKVLADSGLDMRRVITLGPIPNALMPQVYQNTDIGLFPNRCEGGTNLVLCEYMACGKPVIASYSTGQKDVLSDANSIPLRNLQATDIHVGPERTLVGRWFEPNLDEVIDRLEYAYQNRDKLRPLAEHAAVDMGKLTWAQTARQFYELLTKKG